MLTGTLSNPIYWRRSSTIRTSLNQNAAGALWISGANLATTASHIHSGPMAFILRSKYGELDAFVTATIKADVPELLAR